MAPTFSSLDASSYQHPIRGGLFDILQEKTVAVMTERGIEYKTMSEHPISWADDQDPFRHVMGPNYANLAGNCFIRVLESFEEQLKDQYPDFMSGSRIGPMTNNYTMKISRVAKYPDTLITAARVLDVQKDRFHVRYSSWSVAQNAKIAETNTWIVFFDHQKKQTVSLADEGAEYRSLHGSLIARAAESSRVYKAWEEKKEQNDGHKAAKV